MPFFALEEIDKVTPGYSKAFSGDGWSILLVAGDNGVKAVRNSCPHAGWPLTEARVAGQKLRCPRHGYLFDLETGASVRGPREGFGPLCFVPLHEVGGHYAIEL